MKKPTKKAVAKHRAIWQKVAKKNNWQIKKIFVHLWIDEKGKIIDSASHLELTEDIIELTKTKGGK